MKFNEILRHLFIGRWHVSRLIGRDEMARLTAAIKAAEQKTSAQIMIVFEPAFSIIDIFKNITPRDRAIEVFARERVWDTENNNGILLYVLLAAKDFEIVADRGFNRFSLENDWGEICRAVEEGVGKTTLISSVEKAIYAIGEVATKAFPATIEDYKNELSDAPKIL